MATKRQREDEDDADNNGCPSWWHKAKEEIVSKGGYIHPSIVFSASKREMSVTSKVEEANVVMMTIPETCLITMDRAFAMTPWARKHENSKKLNASKFFFTPLADLILAISLAAYDDDNQKKSADDDDIILSYYLETLPDKSTLDALPRRWNKERLEKLLKGSPLLKRIQATKKGVQTDYQKLKTMWEKATEKNNSNNNNNHQKTITSFPSFEKFSDMLAVVSSRAFGLAEQRDGSEEDMTTLVPILDLCNHARGRDGPKKNLTYTKKLVAVEGEEKKKVVVEVRSSQPMESGETLRLTYGAQGNHQLLLNYGFAVPQNTEPDGSSNDVFELQLGDDADEGSTTLPLRTGPKSYTYGSFLQLLADQVNDDGPEAEEGDDQNDENDDMEDFLNAEEDDGGGDVDIYSNPVDDGKEEEVAEDAKDDDETKVDIKIELGALKDVQKVLTRKLEDYELKGAKLKDATSHTQPSPDYFSALVIQSEQRTVYFYIRAAQKIESMLLEKDVPAPLDWAQASLKERDLILVEQQTDELAKTYLIVRHGKKG